MAAAGGAGFVQAARGMGSSLLFVGGRGCGHGTAVAGVAAPRGAGAAVAGPGDGGCVWVARGTGSAVLLVKAGDVDMGRQWRAWRRPREPEWRERGPGGSWRRLGEQERRE